MSHPLSVQLYTVRDAVAEDRDGVLRRLAGIGYRAVEPFQPTEDPKGFRQVADDLGLTVSSVHAGALLGDAPEAVLDAVEILGTGLVIVPAGIPREDFGTADGIARAADTLNGLAERVNARGMRLGYHNHWWEFEGHVDGGHGLEALAGRLDPSVFLEVDTYWAAVGGADVPAVLRRLGERVLALHVKDGPIAKDEPHTAVGAGAMDVPAVLAAAPDAWRIVELDTCATDVFQALADSHAYLTEREQGA
jgi:sugar phosphate isomerase/epimerase